MNFALVNKNFGKIIVILSVIYLLWVGTFGLFYHISEMQTSNSMVNCPFSGQTKCIMNPSELITAWQNIFTSLPQNTGLLNLLILAIILIAAITFWQRSFFKYFGYFVSRWRFYIKQNPQIQIFNYLKEVFSQGILNTKIYDSVTI